MDKLHNIFYTAGCHGNFLKYLFDCYNQRKLLPNPFDENGNSHLRQNHLDINRNFDVCHDKEHKRLTDNIPKAENYVIVWQGLDWFFYAMTASVDRGAHLKQSGIDLLESDLVQYEKQYGVPVYISEFLKQHLDFDCHTQGQPPKSVLRNYFLLTFYKHFEHILWTRNNELRRTPYTQIPVSGILDYEYLSNKLNKIFSFELDFKEVHDIFLNKNVPLQQFKSVKKILQNINKNIDTKIKNLNVISEAFILFCLDVDNFDIPFSIGNDFFKNTKDINDYITYYPNYLKRPNNLFHKHYERYSRNTK